METPHRILIIEDNTDSADSLKFLLELHNHTVEVAYDAKTGIEKTESFVPNVVICDIGLPGTLDGYGVISELKKTVEAKSTFFIALSGYGQSEHFQKSKEAGFDVHFVKPPDFDKLIEVINKL